MMATKARLFGDGDALGRFLAADHPSEAKFSQHPPLRAYLLSTAPRVLVEASPRDRVWGIGLSEVREQLARL